MCIKLGNDELSTVKGLMTMSLNAIVAEVFDMDLDEIKDDLNLVSDLRMDLNKREILSKNISEYFDELIVDFSTIMTLKDLFHTVVESEFENFRV